MLQLDDIEAQKIYLLCVIKELFTLLRIVHIQSAQLILTLLVDALFVKNRFLSVQIVLNLQFELQFWIKGIEQCFHVILHGVKVLLLNLADVLVAHLRVLEELSRLLGLLVEIGLLLCSTHAGQMLVNFRVVIDHSE